MIGLGRQCVTAFLQEFEVFVGNQVKTARSGHHPIILQKNLEGIGLHHTGFGEFEL
jgi:hypothetical protein